MAKLGMEFLGGYRVTLDGAPVTGFESNKVRALLAYLATESHRPQRRESLAALLWPDWPDSAALSNLRYALSDLRKVIGDRTAEPPYLLISREAIQFNPGSDHRLDAAEFSSLVEAQELEQLERGVALYQGEFLEGFSVSEAAPFEDWARLKREQLQRSYVGGMHRLVAELQGAGEIAGALAYAWRLVEAEPLDESGHRQVMRLLAYSGQRAEALAQYEACRKVLKAELKAAPSQETEELHELLLKGELPPITLETPRPVRLARRVGPCPYRGLAAFRELDAPFFFGREEFTQRLVKSVQQRPMVAVIVGSSGSGKSSVVYAGLLPRLRASGDWQIAHFRPGEKPFRALAGALLPLLEVDLSETERLVQVGKLEEALDKGELALPDVVWRVIEKGGEARRLLLVVDQFEELYTLGAEPEMRQRFLDSLLSLASASQQPRYALLLTLRADFMGQALAYRPFADALQQASVLMGPMNRDELRSAVEKPAELQGAAFEAGLVDRLLDEVGEEPGNLPLLEFALTLLWEEAENGWLTHAAYEAVGRVEGALASYADQIYAGLEPDEQEGARKVLLQLVMPGEETADTRRVATKAELGETNWGLVQHLADRRLVVTGWDAAGNEIAEVVHEALIQKWGRLREWMESDRNFRSWQERLRGNLRQWQESGQDEGALLAGAPLSVAEGWLGERGEDLNQAEREYIQASQDLQARHQYERQRRRQRIYLGLAAGLVIALILAGLALYQRQEAVAERQNALRQASVLLAGQAESELANGYHDRAVLLALAALENYPYTPQAEHALGQAVSYNRARQVYPEHQSAVTSVAWSPDGKLMASSGSSDNDVHVWDPATGKTVRILDMPTGITGNQYDMALNVQWAPDGKSLLVITGDRYTLGSQDYDLLQWEVDTGELLSSVEIANQAEPEFGETELTLLNYPTGTAGEITPRGGRLATLGGDNTALIWDAGWEQPELALSGHTKSVSSVDWSPDETRLATASLDGTGRVWDTQTGNALFVLEGQEGRINLALWSPDGSRIATGGADGVIRIWNADDGTLLQSIQTNFGEIFSLAWAPNGVRIVSGHADGSLRIWEAESGKLLETLRGHNGIITDLTWSPVDDRLASADSGGNVRVWNAAPSTAWRLYPPQAARGGDWTMWEDWSSNGRYLAVAGGDTLTYTELPSFSIWDVQENKLLMEKLGDPLNLYGGAVNFSPDDQEIVYLGSNAFPDYSPLATAYVFDAKSGKIVRTFSPGGERLFTSALDWSPDGSQVALGLFDGDVLIFDYQTGRQIASLPHHTDGFLTGYLDWSPDGSKIATANDDGNAYVWDAHTQQPLYSLQHEAPALVSVAAWSPDGKRLLTGGGNDDYGAKDTSARIWDSETGKEILVFSGHTKGVCSGSWSPDGKRIATFSTDGIVKVWDSSTGDELLTLRVPLIYAGRASWSPDGNHLAIMGLETLVSVWRMWQSTEELVEYAKECCVIRPPTEAERKQFALP